MATIPSDAYRAAAAPHDSRATTRILDIDGATDAELALASGAYELRLMDGSIGAWLVPGAATTTIAALASGAPETAGFYLAPGDVVTYWHDATVGDGKLHALLVDTGNATLVCVRKAVG